MSPWVPLLLVVVLASRLSLTDFYIGEGMRRTDNGNMLGLRTERGWGKAESRGFGRDRKERERESRERKA